MAVYLKDPQANVDYSVDWTVAAYLTDGEAITQADWMIEPEETGGLVLSDEANSGTVTAVSIAGGVPGHVYRVTNRIETSGGRTDDRSLMIRIAQL